MKHVTITKKVRLLILSMISIGVFIFIMQEKSFAPSLSLHKNTCAPRVNGLISVTSLKPFDIVTHDFSLEGEARGTWYFEASFPVIALNERGETIATSHGEAQRSWMTEQFVPFVAHVIIPETYKGEICLILKKDNPSSLPENDASIAIPVTMN